MFETRSKNKGRRNQTKTGITIITSTTYCRITKSYFEELNNLNHLQMTFISFLRARSSECYSFTHGVNRIFPPQSDTWLASLISNTAIPSPLAPAKRFQLKKRSNNLSPSSQGDFSPCFRPSSSRFALPASPTGCTTPRGI